MKKVLSSIVAALVAVAFAGIAFAAEPVLPPGHPPIPKQENAPGKEVKKAKKAKKANKAKKEVKKEVKKEEAPAAAPAEKK